MSKFTQEEQTQIVKSAMELTATIECERSELNGVQAQKFQKKPQPPTQKILPDVEKVQPKYPAKPRTNYTYKEFLEDTFNTKKRKICGIILLIIFFQISVIFLIWSLVSFFKKVKQLNIELENSPEYLAAVAEAEQTAQALYEEKKKARDEEQSKLDSQFEDEMNRYNNVIIPKYNENLKKWNEQQQIKINILKNEISYNKETLNNLYDTTKIISAHYRELWILDWLYNDMSTADHDIRYATELLDRDRQRLATSEAAERTRAAVERMGRTCSNGFAALYNAIEEGNDIQADTLSTLSKARRDNNIGHFIGAVQRHNTNKMLNDLL